jgi:NAD(P)-dependent dehydrogenase (short-subunit alcohol dehydrogenase family)
MKNNNISKLFSIENKVIIITGGGGDIGSILSKNMAKLGAHVFSIDKKFEKKISKKSETNIVQLNCDITNNIKFEKICNEIYKKFKKIDVLINNAGITLPQDKDKFYSKKNWLKTLDVNLNASFYSSQTVIKKMIIQKKGSIINITSLNAELAFPNNPAYMASKGGLKMLGKSLAKDWGRYGIRVNNLGPGYIKTSMTSKSHANKKTKKLRENQTMLGRWGDIEDLVGPCVFLASDSSKYITAQDLYVDGGWTSNGLPLN